MARTRGSPTPLTDHDRVRQWAEPRNVRPACVKGTEESEDVGMIRLEFPAYSGEESLEQISWDDWFNNLTRVTLLCSSKIRQRADRKATSISL